MTRLLKGALAHKVRLAHTALAVALAVALVSGTFALGDTLQAAFHRASTASPTGAAVRVRSAASFTSQANSLPEREPLPETLLDTVRSVPGVRSAWGSVWGYAQLVSAKGTPITGKGLPTLGTSWAPGDVVTSGKPPTGDNQVVVDEATAKANGLKIGDTVKVLFQNAVREFVVEGLRRASNLVGSSLATFDLHTTQQALGQSGSLDEIAVQAAPGVTPEVLRSRLAGALADRYEVVTDAQAAQQAEKSWTKALGFLTTGLLVFAGVALLVSAFIIFNTFSILVAQRARELGLLRSLGASRVQLTLSVLAEALAVGAAGSVVGVVGGLGAAHALLALLHSVGLDVPTRSVVFEARTAVAGLVSGVAVTVAAAVIPARRATTAAPLASLRAASGGSGPGNGGGLVRRAVIGAAVVAVGVAELLAGLFGDVPRPLLATAIGATALLAGVAVLAPLAAPAVAWTVGFPLRRLLGEPASLGRDNALRNPSRTASSAAALMIGIGLIGVVSILAASMKASATATVEQTLRADFELTAGGASAGTASGVPPLAAARVRQTPGVASASEVRGGQWGLDGKTMTLLAVDPGTVTGMHELDAEAAAAARKLDDTSVLVRDDVAARHHWKVGDQVSMTFARTGTRKFKLAGTFSTAAVPTDYVISLGAYEANYAQQLDLEVDVQLATGTSASVGRARIRKALADIPNVDVLDRAQVLAAQEKQVKRYLVPITGLLALSVVIALLGIANTLALSVHERIRELGLLRAIGMGRGQLRTMVRTEAMIIAGLGATLGVLVAMVFGSALVGAMHDRGLTRLVVPFRQLLLWVGVAVVAGLLAATLPARRAARLPVLDAVGRE